MSNKLKSIANFENQSLQKSQQVSQVQSNEMINYEGLAQEHRISQQQLSLSKKNKRQKSSVVNRVEKDLTDHQLLDRSDTQGKFLNDYINNGFAGSQKEIILHHQSLLSLKNGHQIDQFNNEDSNQELQQYIQLQDYPNQIYSREEQMIHFNSGFGDIITKPVKYLADELNIEGNIFGLKEPTILSQNIDKYRDQLKESQIKGVQKMNKQDKVRLKNTLMFSQNKKLKRFIDSTNITSHEANYTQTPVNYIALNSNSNHNTQSIDRSNLVLKGLKEKYMYSKQGSGQNQGKNLKNINGAKEASKFQHTLKSIGEGSQASSFQQSMFPLRNKTEDNYAPEDTQLRQNQETSLLKRTQTVRHYENTIQEDKIQFQNNTIKQMEKSLEDVRLKLLNADSGLNLQMTQTILRPIQLDEYSRNSTNNARVYSIEALSNANFPPLINNSINPISPYILGQSMENLSKLEKFKAIQDFEYAYKINE
eukprot:403359597